MEQPRWMVQAWAQLFEREYAGAPSNPQIADFFRDAGHPDITQDDVPWCAAFVGACLDRAGHSGSGSLRARSYLGWGTAIDTAKLGAVAVLSRGRNPSAGHVGFVIGESEDTIILLGGNQGNAVSVARFSKDRLLGLRWPAQGDPQPRHQTTPLFDIALAHVLEMEGGFSNDPYDPGGPTNMGITLETYASFLKQPLRDASHSNLLAKLRAIDSRTVREIYQSRYWTPSKAEHLAPPLALMHFDASVNQGVHGAARMLQQALNVAVDGEIGPITLSAAGTRDPQRTTEQYAEVRRNRYRSLHHFWRFGRGWLSRVDKTLKRARSIRSLLSNTVPPVPQSEGDHTMTTFNGQSTGPKLWGSSMTIWGAVITTLSTVLPMLAPAFGLDITPNLIKEIGEQLVSIGQALGGLIGTAMTVYGRSRASAPLTRKQVKVSV
ncbi:MAG: TIGR02594 family protein [Hyphomicrobiaceae bacterium]